MSRENESWCIIKKMTPENGKPQRVILVDNMSEVLEYKSQEKAEKIAAIFEANSESGWTYSAKKIGSQN